MVQNQALLGPMGVAGRFGCVGGLRRLRRIALQRRDGPPAAVGGGQVVGGRHDSPKSEGGKQEASAATALSPSITWPRRACPSPSLALSLPPFPVNVITHWARGGGARGSRELTPSSSPWPAPGPCRKSRQSSVKLGGRARGAVGKWTMSPSTPVWPVTCLRFHHCKHILPLNLLKGKWDRWDYRNPFLLSLESGNSWFLFEAVIF